MSAPDRPTRTGQYSRPAPGTSRRLAGPERTHPPVSTRPAGIPRITLVFTAALLTGVLVLMVDSTAAIVLCVAVAAGLLLKLTVGFSQIPLLGRLTGSRRN